MQLSARERTILAGAAGVASIIGVGYLIQRELRRWRLLSTHMAQVMLPAHCTSHRLEPCSLFSCIFRAFLRLLSAVSKTPLFSIASICAPDYRCTASLLTLPTCKTDCCAATLLAVMYGPCLVT